MQHEDIEHRFNYHPPSTGTVVDKHEETRDRCKLLAHRLDELCGPDSREKSLAITHLEECMMWANAAIARNCNETPAL